MRNSPKILVLTLIILLCGVGFGDSIFTGDQVSIFTGVISGSIESGNSKIIEPGDDIQQWYDWLKSSDRDAEMGALAVDNRRILILAPGTYTMDYTVLMDTDFVDVLALIEDTVTITKSGNGMGITVLPGIDGILFTADDRLYVGCYSRNSVAGDDNNNDYAANEVILPSVSVSSILSAATELDNEASGDPISIQYQASGLGTPLLFGKFSDQVWTSVDGTTWAFNGSSHPSIKTMWAADDSGNCVVADSLNPPNIYYGTYAGGTLTTAKAQKAGSDFSFASNAVDKFNFIRLESGTLLLSEYSSGATQGRYIYKSTDLGHTWDVAYDAGVGVTTHFHTFGELKETNRIIAVSGDAEKTRTVYSDDDGENWAVLVDTGVNEIQPVDTLDIGHPTKLLFADDTNVSAGLYDVYTGEIIRVMFDTDHRTARGFIWSFSQNEGIVYASGYSTGDLSRNVVIYATTDLVNWTVIYRLQTADAYGVNYLVFFASTLQGWIVRSGAVSAAHMNITPPVLSSRQAGVQVEQGVTNLFSDTATSSYEDANFENYITCAGGTVTQVDSTDLDVPYIPNGTKAIRVTHPTASAIIAPTREVPLYGKTVTTGDIRSGSIKVGVPIGGIATLFEGHYLKGDGSPMTNRVAAGEPFVEIVEPGQWLTYHMPPILVDAADSGKMGYYFSASANSGSLNLLFDEVQITGNGGQPSSWQVGGTPRASAFYDLPWSTEAKATHAFIFEPFAKSTEYDYLGGDWYIRSWWVSATVYADLYYDSDDQTFKLHVVSGAANDLITTAALWFKKGHPISFIVQFGDDDDSNIHLSVGSGRTIETVDGAAEDYSALGNAAVNVRWGDIDGANGLNGSIYDLDFTGEVAAANLVTYLDGKI